MWTDPQYNPIYNSLKGEPLDITDTSGIIFEPVSPAEFKNYARTQGFEDDAESGELLFTSDDDLIEEMITAARERFEKWSGRSVVRHKFSQVFSNEVGDIEIPYSNNYDIVSLSDSDGVEILAADYKVRDHEFLFLECPKRCNMTIVYWAGPGTPADVPKTIKLAILRDALFYYENRNDGDDKENKSFSIAAKYRRTSTWLA